MKNPESRILEKLQIKWHKSVYKDSFKRNNNYISFEEYLIVGNVKEIKNKNIN